MCGDSRNRKADLKTQRRRLKEKRLWGRYRIRRPSEHVESREPTILDIEAFKGVNYLGS